MRNFFIVISLLVAGSLFAQADTSPKERTDSIQGMRFTIPEFFVYQRTDSTAFMEMRNNDTSICQMRIFPAFRVNDPDALYGRGLWRRFVLTTLGSADTSFRQQVGDTLTGGWRSRIYVGNYLEGGKRAIVFLFWMSKGKEQRITVCNFSDRIFRQPVERFSHGLQPSTN
jgi:hypothetical protein